MNFTSMQPPPRSTRGISIMPEGSIVAFAFNTPFSKISVLTKVLPVLGLHINGIRRSNQSMLKEISPGCSLEGLTLKLKLQYFGHLMEELTHWKRPWCWDRLKAGEEGDDRGWDGWMASPTWCTWLWISSRSWWWTGKPGMLQSIGSQRAGHNWVTELNWTQPR